MADVDRKLDEWVKAGLLEREQAERIREHEHGTDGGVAVWQEALGYVGATLALSALGLLLEDVWVELTVGAQLAVTVALAAALTVTGWVVFPGAVPSRRRLGSLLLAAGTVATAWGAGIAVTELTDWGDAGSALTVGAIAGTHAVVLWCARPAPLQEVAAFAAAGTVLAGLLLLPEIEPAALYVGLSVWTLGAVWALLAQVEVLRPARTGVALGLLAVGVGAQIAASGDARVLGLWLGIASTAAVLAVGALRTSVLLLAFGAAGVVIFIPQVVFHLFEDTVAAPVALLLVGVIVVVVAAGGFRLTRDRDGAPRDRDGAAA